MLTSFIRAAQDPLLKAALVGEGSLSNCDQSQTEALPVSARRVTFVAYSFRRSSSGSLVKSACHGPRLVARQPIWSPTGCDAAICPKSGEKRKCAACA